MSSAAHRAHQDAAKMHRSERGPESRQLARYGASFFGPFRITRNDKPLAEPIRRNRAASLLKWFLLNPVQRISRDDLCDLFWPDRGKDSAINNLHVTLHYLRHVLEPEHPPGSPSTFICHNPDNFYWFDPGDLWWTDVLEVQSLSADAEDADRRGEAAQAIALYDQMISYYRLGFLPEDIYDDAFAPYRHEYDLAYARSLDRLVQLHLNTGQLSGALSYALDAMRIDPYSRDAVKAIVQVHARQGNVTGAVGQLDDFISALERDAGIVSDNELLALRDALNARVRKSGRRQISSRPRSAAAKTHKSSARRSRVHDGPRELPGVPGRQDETG